MTCARRDAGSRHAGELVQLDAGDEDANDLRQEDVARAARWQRLVRSRADRGSVVGAAALIAVLNPTPAKCDV
jgi:hypothetical protein